MGKISKILISLICLLGFATSVSAASYSSSITAYQTGDKYEYISGLPIYYNRASSYDLYVLDTNTYFNTKTTLTSPIEVDSGFAYIINNSNVTNSTYKNYYIANAAILWYEDYLNGNNNNISSSLKETIKSKTNDTVCYYITKLVNNAINYEDNNLINILDDEITFTRDDNYYYSNVIDVEVNGLKTKPSVTLYNAPSNATIINNTVTNNGTGSFQIRIPVSSINQTGEKDFLVNVTGSGYNYTYYKYTYNTSEVIYGRSYSTNYGNVEDSRVVNISNLSNTLVRIKVVDNFGDYISGIKYEVYKGNCENSTCDSDDLLRTYTSGGSYYEYRGVLKTGYYTLVRKTNNINYSLAEKELIYVNNVEQPQMFVINGEKIKNNEDNREEYDIDEDTPCEILIMSNLGDSTNIIKIYKNDGTLVDSFRSDKESHTMDVYLGKYYIKDTKGHLVDINFEMTKKGLTLNGKYTETGYSIIDLDDYLKRTTQDVVIDKEEEKEESKEENIYKDENGNIHIENLDGTESIEIEQKVETSTTIEWLSEVIDCPITSLSSTIKYITGAIILGIGILMVVLNVKKRKNNN